MSLHSWKAVFFTATLFPTLLFTILSPSVPAVELDAKDVGAVTIVSDSMEADNRSNLVVFRGDVVAKERFTLCSDELRITYNDAEEIGEIVASGSVRVIKDDKVARAAKARYDRIEATMVLTGKPSIEQCGDSVSGNQITFNIEDETAMVEAGTDGRVRAVIMPEKKDCARDAVLEENICRGSR